MIRARSCIGECFFEVYHERTDVAIDPGLRELWAAGSADPNSDWGKTCIENIRCQRRSAFRAFIPALGVTSTHPHRCIGSEIWAGVDDIAFLPDGKIVSSENGNAYWGLVDGWRRPKPELELSQVRVLPGLVPGSSTRLPARPGFSAGSGGKPPLIHRFKPVRLYLGGERRKGQSSHQRSAGIERRD